MAKAHQGFDTIKSARKRRALARLGGRTAQRMGVAHRWTPEEAHAKAVKGGITTAARRRARAQAALNSLFGGGKP